MLHIHGGQGWRLKQSRFHPKNGQKRIAQTYEGPSGQISFQLSLHKKLWLQSCFCFRPTFLIKGQKLDVMIKSKDTCNEWSMYFISQQRNV